MSPTLASLANEVCWDNKQGPELRWVSGVPVSGDTESLGNSVSLHPQGMETVGT